MNPKIIIKENYARKQRYSREYFPELGDCDSEVIPRVKVEYDSSVYYLPEDMIKVPQVAALMKSRNTRVLLKKVKANPTAEDIVKFKARIKKLRFKFDFEYWAVTCIKIQDKLSGQMIPFRLNFGQRRLIGTLETQRLNNEPMRVILVKARQWGGSTAVQIYMLWLQLFHYENWHSVIIGKDKQQSANIRNMIKKAINNYPLILKDFTYKALTDSNGIRHIEERGCEIVIGTSNEPDSVRSFNIMMCHMSEVGLWVSTKSKSGDDLAQAVYGAISNAPGTLIVMESTAKGVGNYFHSQYIAAQTGKSEFKPVFVAWFEIPMYSSRINNYEKFIATLSDYEWWLFEQGATLEGIKWYRDTKSGRNYSDFAMKSEFPTTANEAFQSSTGTYFPEPLIEKCRKTACYPQFMGDIRGLATTGEKSLKGISIFDTSSSTETLRIYEYPDINEEYKILNRYLVVVDIGGKSYKSDNSVISVYDRISIMEPFGALEKVAEWIGHIDHDLLAWKAAQIATYYDDALLVIESNTIDSRDKKHLEIISYEGNHFYTVLNELSGYYPNLFYRERTPDQIKAGEPARIGWHMNRQTKYLAYDRYYSAVRNDEYIERSHDAVNEMQWLITKPSGQIEAQPGRRDDTQDVNAIACYIGLDIMEVPKKVQRIKQSKATKRIVGVGVASI